jgi:N-acetylglucosamine-6-phosphate deacetylase
VALVAATRTPADALGRPDIGRLGTGTRADVVAFDRDLRVTEVWVGGEAVPRLRGV